jgi:beta-1,4-N-acetylglucosaminyltransferase
VARTTPDSLSTLFLDYQEFRDVQYLDMIGQSESIDGARPSKVCFVTIGATASFDRLLSAVFESPFLQALHDGNYTGLIIQYGKEGGKTIYDEFVATKRESVHQELAVEVTGFDFNTNGLGQEMRKAKGDPTTGSEEGLVISHAGWTILSWSG